MSEESFSELATPTLIRAARGAYAQAIRTELLESGMDDMPRNGIFVLAGVASTGGPRPDLASSLGVTKQAVSLLIDTLVTRGYLERGADPDDRRRLALELTDRGRQVLDAAGRGIATVDAKLLERVPAEQVVAMRSVLAALAEIKSDSVAAGTGAARAERQLRSFAPIFPVKDLTAALAHYSSLGFATIAYEGGDEYGFANRDGVELHLGVDRHEGHDHDGHGHGGVAYLHVTDADALYEEWTRPGIGGSTSPVHDTPYKIREGVHIDPDGNMIRFGSFVEE
jgi:DNA-binding MarR family transcriptional regulator